MPKQKKQERKTWPLIPLIIVIYFAVGITLLICSPFLPYPYSTSLSRIADSMINIHFYYSDLIIFLVGLLIGMAIVRHKKQTISKAPDS
ncbi:MAG: hypothetical protein NTX24_02665 [Candidatus Pacearchaeota archaeon]|nr:hypothetical protein [Candidatus Pacearchaeota archaeon]